MEFKETAEGALQRRKAVNSLTTTFLSADRRDRIDQILTDPLADMIAAASADGFTREELLRAVFWGAWHGWSDVRAKSIGESESDDEGRRFAKAVGRVS